MTLKTELYPYQNEAVKKLTNVKIGALYMEMGTGKTRTALELIKIRLDAAKVKQVLWLCPFSCVKDLPELLSEHVSDFLHICKIVGIESLSTSVRINEELDKYVSSAPTYLIVDESLLVKNPQAYRTRNIIRLSQKCEYKLILNGTPISRNIADLFAQWYILDWRVLGYRSYWSFSANHLEFDKAKPNKLVRAHNVEYLTRKIAPYTYEMSKSILSLPPKKYHHKTFCMTVEQDEHYQDVMCHLLSQVDDFRPETIYKLFGALQAITSGFAVKEEHGHLVRHVMYSPENNPRINALLHTLSNIGEEQAVVYCKFTQEIYDILSVLGDAALPFYGDMSPRKRQLNKNAFRDGKAKYLVANKSCAQFGLNLQFCSNEVFYNNDWDWGTRVQAEDRLHRVGQKSAVHIYDIIASDSIDNTILQCLEHKESLADKFKSAIHDKNAITLLARGNTNA